MRRSPSACWWPQVGNESQGHIATLTMQAKNVRIAPEANSAAPSHRVFVLKADYAERGIMRSDVA